MKTPAAGPAFAALVLALMIAGQAAADQATEAKWRHACWQDAFSFCTFRAISGDRAGVRDCLVHNIDRISAACRDVIHDAGAHGVKGTDAAADQPTPSSNQATGEPLNR